LGIEMCNYGNLKKQQQPADLREERIVKNNYDRCTKQIPFKYMIYCTLLFRGLKSLVSYGHQG